MRKSQISHKLVEALIEYISSQIKKSEEMYERDLESLEDIAEGIIIGNYLACCDIRNRLKEIINDKSIEEESILSLAIRDYMSSCEVVK